MKIYWLILILSSLFISSCSSTLNLLKYTVPDIEDCDIFSADTIHTSSEPFSFFKIKNQELPPAYLWTIGKEADQDISVEEFLEENATTAFIVIRKDSILYERYFDGYSRENFSQVFSVTKSVVATLVGIAVAEGKIKSIYQPVSDFLPYFDADGREKITINHLLQMTSGLNHSDYKTVGKLLNLYYSQNQERLVRRTKVKYEPGTRFAYKSIATQILGMCLQEATGQKITEYLEEKLWKPLGMEYNATMALEKKGGVAKMYGGLTASAIDLAKLGRLYLNNGNWNGTQILPEDWVIETGTADTTNGCSPKYSNCWWLDTYPREVGYCNNDFFAGGYRGQVVYVNPITNTVMIRIGKKESGVEWPQSMSKLALIYSDSYQDCGDQNFAFIEGKYKSESGQFFGLKWLDNILVLEDFTLSDKVELRRDSNISFITEDRQMKIIVDYRNHEVKGLFLENKNKALFLEKI